MNFDFQLSTSTLTAAVAAVVSDLLANNNLGVGGIQGFPFDAPRDLVTNQPGVINHLEVLRANTTVRGTTTATISTATGSIPLSADVIRLQVIVAIHAARISDLREAGLDPIDPARLKQFHVRITVALGQPVAAGDALELPIAVEGLELGIDPIYPEPTEFSEELRATLTEIQAGVAAIPLDPIRLELTDLLAELDGRTLVNAGLASISGGIAMRLQFERTPIFDPFGLNTVLTRAAWTSFLAGPPVTLGGRAWSLSFPSEFFVEIVERTLNNAIGELDPSEFELNEDGLPESTWSVSGGTIDGAGCSPGGAAAIQTRFSIAAKDACEPWGFDIDVNSTLDVAFAMPRPGFIRADLRLDFSKDPGDVIACVGLNGFLLSSAGLVVGGVLGGGWIGAIVGSVIGGLLGSIGTMVLIETAPTEFESSELNAVEGEENAFWTEVALPALSNRALGRLTPIDLTPCRRALVVAGSAAPPTPRVHLFRRFDKAGFRWAPIDSECPPTGVLAYAFAEGLRSASQVPLQVWNVSLLDPPTPEAYRDRLELPQNNHPRRVRVDLELSVDDVRALRDDGPAQIELLIQTNLGARLIGFAGVGDELSEDALARERDGATRRCEARRRRREDFEERAGRVFDLIDPFWLDHIEPIGPIQWSVFLSGLTPNETISVVRVLPNAEARILGSVAADPRGLAAATIWERAPSLEEPIALRLGGKGPSSPTVAASGQLFRTIADVELLGGYHDHVVTRRGDSVQIAVTTSAGAELYEIQGRTGLPRRTQTFRSPALRGLQWHEDGALAWGEAGAFLLMPKRAVELLCDPVFDVAVDGGRIYALTQRALWSFGPAQGESKEVCAGGSGRLEREDRRLTVPGAGGSVELESRPRARRRRPVFCDGLDVRRIQDFAVFATASSTCLTIAALDRIVTS